jgi:ABC-type multidrug transport system fused ATPase/permease subunit
MLNLYRTIWHVSSKTQVLLILLSLLIAALAAAPLKFQQEIINLLSDQGIPRSELVQLCAGMSGVILLSLGLKMIMGYRASMLGEDVTRLIRRRIFEARATGDENAAEVPTGTLAAAISAEAEEVGKFAGSAFSEPLVQFGTLLSVITFVAATEPGLGVVAAFIVLPQVIIVQISQKRINRFVEQRIRLLRATTNQITTEDIHSVEAAITEKFDEIFETRRKIFGWKVATKFLLSLTNSGGTVLVLLLGGLLVAAGRSDVGTVVAATTGLARIQGPTTDLIAFYREISVNRVKYDLLAGLVMRPRT